MNVQWIVQESDTGENLNRSLHTDERARFNFLLASINPEYAPELTSKEEEEQLWTPPFAVPKGRDLYMSEQAWKHCRQPSLSQSFTGRFFEDCLRPEPFTAKPDGKQIPLEVQANSPHWAFAPKQSSQIEKNEAGLLDIIEQIYQTH